MYQETGQKQKRCWRCKTVKPITEFHRDRSRPDGLNHECKVCSKERANAWYAKRKDVARDFHREYELNYYYGITRDDYDRLYEEQGGLCYICHEKPERELSVDHDHVTHEVRGLLCRTCNSALGLFKDDPALLERALEYLNRNPRKLSGDYPIYKRNGKHPNFKPRRT